MPAAIDNLTQSQVDAVQAKISADPDIQALLRQERARLVSTRDQGGASRAYQNKIRDQITLIAQQKGYLPEEGSWRHYFVNPNDGQIEPHRGWSGLSGWQKTAIIAAAVASGGIAAAALAGGGGGSAASSAAASGGTAAGAGAAAGAGTAATVGAVAAQSASWLTPILQYGVPAATGIVGNLMAANGERDAARLSDQQFDKALAAEKEERDYQRSFNEEARGYNRAQYADYLGRLSPYGNAGSAAVDRASSLLTTSRYRPELVGAPQGAGVQMRAPTGETSVVPETMIDHYERLGAVRV